MYFSRIKETPPRESFKSNWGLPSAMFIHDGNLSIPDSLACWTFLEAEVRPGAHFSKSCLRDPGFNSLASTMIELSANETKWSSLVARIRALILMCRVDYLISGPKNYRDFRETGPWAPVGCNVAVVSSRIVLPLLQPPWHRANSARNAKLMHAARQLPGKPRNQDNRNTCKAPK